MKKIIFCLLLFFTFSFSVRAEFIEDFNAVVKVNKDATIDIIETITYDFENQFKHGIFRTIPYIKKNNVGKKFNLEFSNFSFCCENIIFFLK